MKLAAARFWKKQLYKLITLATLPVVMSLAIVIYPIIWVISFVYKLYGINTVDLKFLLQRFVGIGTIIHYYNSEHTGIKKILSTAWFFAQESSTRLTRFLLGNSVVNNIVDNAKLVVNSNVAISIRIKAACALLWNIITAPLQTLYSYPRRILGACIYMMIMPKTFAKIEQYPVIDNSLLRNNNAVRLQLSNHEPSNNPAPYKLKEWWVATRSKVYLQTMELIHNNNTKQSPRDIHYVIKFTGNGEALHCKNVQNGKSIVSYCEDGSSCDAIDAEDVALYGHNDKKDGMNYAGANVILFNHRGVLGSSSSVNSTDDVIEDGIAMVDFLLDKGAQAQNITLDGISLGGATAILVANKLQQRGIEVKVYADRTFYKIGAFPLYNERHTYEDRKDINASFLGVWNRCVLKWIGCEMHAGKAGCELLKAATDNNPSRLRVMVANAPLDEMIAPPIALDKYLCDEDIKGKYGNFVDNTVLFTEYNIELKITNPHYTSRTIFPEFNPASFKKFIRNTHKR